MDTTYDTLASHKKLNAMKLFPLLLLTPTLGSAFSLRNNGPSTIHPRWSTSLSAQHGRSALSQQYKSIMSIHYGLDGPRMMPPPTDPEPEVGLQCIILFSRHELSV